MRLETLITLLEERKRAQHAVVKKPITKAQLDKIRFKGISDEEIELFVIPQLIQWEIDGNFSKENLDKFLKTCPGIHLLPAPIRHEVDKTKKQRQMDSLARLLTPSVDITPCVAIAFYEGKPIISSNSPKGETEQELVGYLVQKMAIIRDFLSELAKDVHFEPDTADITHIRFSTRARLLADRAISLLMAEDCGGVGEILPSKAHRKHNDTEEHLNNALFKLGHAYLLGLYTDGARGFSHEDMQALSSAAITVLTPNDTELENQELHAEQAILYYLKSVHHFEEET